MNANKKINIAIALFFLLTGCEQSSQPEADPIKNSPTIKHGVWGFVQFWEGDFMPGAPSGKKTFVKRKLVFHELTTPSQLVYAKNSSFVRKINSARIDSVESNDDGFFQINMSEGKYSVFIQEDSLYYFNTYDLDFNVSSIQVKKDSLSFLQFNITYKAVF